MIKRCFDEGFLQAYVDGELSPEQASEAAAHLAACEACAGALVAAEREAAFFAVSFAPDESVSVPTEILRARVSAAVAQLESTRDAYRGGSRGWNFGGLLAPLSGLFSFTPRGAATFAGLLAILAFATVFFIVQKSRQPTNSIEIARRDNAGPTSVATHEANPIQPKVGALTGATPEIEGEGTFMPAGVKSPRVNKKNTGRRRVAPPRVREQFLQGEKDYQTAIASLEKTIKMGGDAVLSPSVRVKYERNLAILDSAIGETRRVAVANPKDRDAANFLMAAYQSKVELLTKVADQAQVAAVGR